jgi:hypothetical protein
MSYTAAIYDVADADGMPLWESADQLTAEAAYELAEKHIHAMQPDDQIVPTDRGEYAVRAQNDQGRSTQVATLTVTTTDDPPTTAHQIPGSRDPRVVGGRYRSHYWGFEYTVLAISFTDYGILESITVRDDQGTRIHATGWDDRDEILFDPRVAHPDAGGPGADRRRQP